MTGPSRTDPTQHVVIGAGPAGLVAALSLVRSGRTVCVLERSTEFGHRFAGDFQGLKNQARCITADRLSPAGYAYVLAWNGQATLATCLFRSHSTWRKARDSTTEAFVKVLPALRADLADARPFSGHGSVFPRPRFMDEAGRLSTSSYHDCSRRCIRCMCGGPTDSGRLHRLPSGRYGHTATKNVAV